MLASLFFLANNMCKEGERVKVEKWRNSVFRLNLHLEPNPLKESFSSKHISYINPSLETKNPVPPETCL